MTTTTTNRPDIPAPADATEVTDWEPIFSLEELHRFFYGTQRGTEGVRVGVNGYQNPDGSVRQRWIHVSTNKLGDELDAATARQLARALIAAADELDELAG